jgi:hypothetical protein
VPVSVTTVWAEAVRKAATRKSAAKVKTVLWLRVVFLNMEILLFRSGNDVSADIVGVRLSPPVAGVASSY